MTFPENELTALKTVADSVKSFGMVALVVGLLSMAFIQTGKDLLPLRKWFHVRRIKRWFEAGIENYKIAEREFFVGIPRRVGSELWSISPRRPEIRGSSFAYFRHELGFRFFDSREAGLEVSRNTISVETGSVRALDDLVRLATAGDESALFNLPIEQLCGQLNAAVQLALEDPRNHVVFLWAIGRFESSSDLDEILNPPLQELRLKQNELKFDDRGSLENFAGARARISQRLQRSVDGFQIATGNFWKLILQEASIVLSMLLAFFALRFGPTAGQPNLRAAQAILTVIGVGLAGGFIAPIARDIAAVIQAQKK